MDEWTNLCRCCLSAEVEISLLDEEENVKEKFLEVTTIDVEPDDGLPQMLCSNCYSILNTASEFRQQCLKMDCELKIQQESILKLEAAKEIEMEKNVIDKLMTSIKTEPDDDDCYYVLVIDDPEDDKKDKDEEEPAVENVAIKQEKVKQESIHNEVTSVPSKELEENSDQRAFEDSYNAFLNTKVPANVPATILENEEESPETEDNNYHDEILDKEDSRDSSAPSEILPTQSEDSQDQAMEIQVAEQANAPPNKNNVIKILTTTGADGTLLLNSDADVQFLTENQLVAADGEDDEDDPMNQEEVIFCEGDESSQFQILNCDGSELVIEYAGGDQIATVLQQEDGSFLCDCGEEFEDLGEFEKHQHKHNPAGDHLCNLCGKGFESAEILTGHMLLHSVPGLLVTCPFCNQQIRRNALTQHIKYGHNNIKPQCGICNKTFANPNNLKRHMMIHTGVREFECDICFKRFHQKITMQTHRLTHVNPFACHQCDMLFENKAAVMEHKESNECTKSKIEKVKEKLMQTVKQQITTSVGKLLGYACSLCKKMFSVESALEQHIESTHMMDPTELLCSECGEVIPSKKEMQSHILTHKTYKSRNAKRFECSVCGKGCASQAMLIMHERVHTNERPFPCALCSLRFKTKTHLRTHQLTHTREKKFGCSICMKFFALKGNLVVHLRTHTGERPYVCSLCGEAFIDSKYLKKHKLKKHAIDNVPWNQY